MDCIANLKQLGGETEMQRKGARIAVKQKVPNSPTAPNPAIASGLHTRHHWRGVGEPECWAK